MKEAPGAGSRNSKIAKVRHVWRKERGARGDKIQEGDKGTGSHSQNEKIKGKWEEEKDAHWVE